MTARMKAETESAVQSHRDKKLQTRLVNIGLVCFALVTIIGIIKAVFVSLDIDESYAVACAYRMTRGDHLLRDMYEPHQFSSLFLLPFVALYTGIAGTTTGIVIFLRVVGVFLRALVGWLFVRCFRDRLPKPALVFIFLVHMNFLPKWIQLPEFELLHYLLILLLFVCMDGYYRAVREETAGKTGTRRALILAALAGVVNFGLVLNYPDLILLWPLLVFVILKLGQQGKKLTSAVTYTAGLGVPGLLLLGYLFTYLDLNGIITGLKHMASDPSHGLSKMTMLTIHAQQLTVPALICLGIAIVPAVVAQPAVFGKRSKSRTADDGFKKVCHTTFILTTVVAVITCGYTAYQYIAGIGTINAGMWRYLPIAFGGLVIALMVRDEHEALFYGLLLPSFVGEVLILLMTNMDAGTAMSKLFPAVLGTLVLFTEFFKGKASPAEYRKLIPIYICFVLALLLPLLVSRLYLIRITGCANANITANMKTVEYGPAKGIRMISSLADAMNDDYRELTSRLTGDDGLLYIGTEHLVYLSPDAEICAASTLSTSVFNRTFVEYLYDHEGKSPTVIAVDKLLAEHEGYFNSPYNQEFLDYIEVGYGYSRSADQRGLYDALHFLCFRALYLSELKTYQEKTMTKTVGSAGTPQRAGDGARPVQVGCC